MSTTIQLGNWLTTTPALTALNWQNTNSIVQSISALNSPSGNLPITNATINESVVVGGKTVAVPVGYQSRFLYADAILDCTIKTPSERFPFHLLLDYEQNTRAASRNRHGYWVESALGRLSEKHDIQFGYTWDASNKMP